jgi:hypothetical protein
VTGLFATWTALQSAFLQNFTLASAYGAPALGGALALSVLYYAGRRQARGRRMSAQGFLRSIFPRRILLHPSSLIDMRLWALNGVAFTSAYGMLGLGLFFWRDAVVAGLTHGFGPHGPMHWPAWTILTLACASGSGLRTRLLVRPLLFSQGPRPVGVPQGEPLPCGLKSLVCSTGENPPSEAKRLSSPLSNRAAVMGEAMVGARVRIVSGRCAGFIGVVTATKKHPPKPT